MLIVYSSHSPPLTSGQRHNQASLFMSLALSVAVHPIFLPHLCASQSLFWTTAQKLSLLPSGRETAVWQNEIITEVFWEVICCEILVWASAKFKSWDKAKRKIMQQLARTFDKELLMPHVKDCKHCLTQLQPRSLFCNEIFYLHIYILILRVYIWDSVNSHMRLITFYCTNSHGVHSTQSMWTHTIHMVQ